MLICGIARLLARFIACESSPLPPSPLLVAVLHFAVARCTNCRWLASKEAAAVSSFQKQLDESREELNDWSVNDSHTRPPTH